MPPHRPQPTGPLQEHGLALENVQSLLEALDLRLAAALHLLVRSDRLVALGVEALQHGLHGVQLLLHARAVRLALGGLLVTVGGLLCLVLQVLLLVGPVDRVLLGGVVVLCDGGLLGGNHLRQELREVRLDNLEKAYDAGARALGRHVRLVLRVVLAQDLQRQLHALEALLHLRAALVVDRLLVRADLVHLGLRLGELRERLLQGGHLALQLCRAGGPLVDLGAQLLDLRNLVRFLLLVLAQLLVAIGLVVRVGCRLVLEFRDHVGDEALHLGKGVVAGGLARANRGGHAHGQLRQGLRILLLGQALNEAHRLEVREVDARRDAGAELQEGVALLASPGGGLLEHLLGLCERLQLLVARFHLRLEGLGLLHAVGVQRGLGALVGGHVLRRRGKVALGLCLGGTAGAQALLGIAQVGVTVLDLVLQILLQDLEVLQARGLRLPEAVELRVGLVQQVLERRDDAAVLLPAHAVSVALVHVRVGRAQVAVVLAGLLHVLEKRGELTSVAGAKQRGLHHGLQRVDDAGALDLQHRGGADLGHLALEDGDGALQRVDHLDEFLLLGSEVRLLLGADLRGGLQVGGVKRELGGQLLDLRVETIDVGALLGDGGLQAGDLPRGGLD
mmetsp:Transcript_6604/g.15166  ORF Transcript_6604/g.15166 Transcript_6604/m.15166 type:complete len:619 (+) Transcript_6604:125-1981(+)